MMLETSKSWRCLLKGAEDRIFNQSSNWRFPVWRKVFFCSSVACSRCLDCSPLMSLLWVFCSKQTQGISHIVHHVEILKVGNFWQDFRTAPSIYYVYILQILKLKLSSYWFFVFTIKRVGQYSVASISTMLCMSCAEIFFPLIRILKVKRAILLFVLCPFLIMSHALKFNFNPPSPPPPPCPKCLLKSTF